MADSKSNIEDIEWNAQSEDGQVMLSVAWEIFVLGVAILSIVNLFLAVLVRDPDIVQIVTIVDGIFILIFMVDFVRRIRVADDARKYVVKGWGWLDLISIIPMLRIARILRIVRVSRVLKRMGGASAAMQAFFASRATGGLLLVFLIAILVLEYGAMLVLYAEKDAAGATILDARDAIWYIIVTMSTVGYGDTFPVTDLGRVFGTMIILVGVGVFGTLTGFLANAFMAPADEPAEGPSPEDSGATA